MKLSIIIPTYNREAFIGKAIESVLSQSVEDVEIIVVDDGSTDNTKDVVLGFKDKRIVYDKFSENRGANSARNRAIQLASGDWIGYLDSDDRYLENAFNTVLEVLDGKGKDMDIVGFLTTRAGGKRYGYVGEGGWDFIYPTYEDIVLKKNINGDINHFFKRNLFYGEFKFPEYVNGLEILLTSKLAKYGKKFMYVNKVIYEVFRDPNYSLSAESYNRWPGQFAKGYSEFVTEHFSVLSKYPDRLVHYYLRIAKCYFKIFDPRSLWYLAKAFFIEPKSVSSLIGEKIKNSFGKIIKRGSIYPEKR